VPIGSAFPAYVRVLTGPFNIAGALSLIFGAIYSAYVYMPKNRALPARLGVLAVTVNFVASLPGAMNALLQGKLNSRVPATILIALGAFIPGLTSGLNRFGVTWSFFLGEFLGVVLIFAGFLVSEEVFRNVRIGTTLWSRAPSGSLEHEVG
jgi:type III secretory pathway component EscT